MSSPASIRSAPSGEVLIGKHADSGEMIHDRLQIEVRLVAAGQGLKIRVREGIRDCVEVDDVPDHEAVMPGARLQAYSVLERQSPNACFRFYPDCDIAGSQRLLQ